MTLVSLSNALLGDMMVERFHADPRVQATELLLQERVPRQAPIAQPRPAEETHVGAARGSGGRSPLPLGTTRGSSRAVPVERQLHRRRHQRGRGRQLLPWPRGPRDTGTTRRETLEASYLPA